MPVPSLNWREIQAMAKNLNTRVVGAWVERVIVPARPFSATGFLKGEVYLRLSGPQAERAGVEGLVLNLRPRESYLYCVEKTPLVAAPSATKSAFIQMLGKYLSGAKCLGVESVDRERILVFWFSAGRDAKISDSERLGLLLVFKPSKTEAFLLTDNKNHPATSGAVFRVLGSSREAEPPETFCIPDGAGAPESPESKLTWTESTVTDALKAEGQAGAYEKALRAWKERQSHAAKARKMALQAMAAGENEPDWEKFGEVVKAHLGSLANKKRKEKSLTLEDFESGESVVLPWNPKLTPQEIARDFFQKAKQKRTRIEEAKSRLATAERILAEQAPAPGAEASSAPHMSGGAPMGKAAPKLWPKHWGGKVFLSAEGLPILVGRNNKENLELTTKVAKGNDLWFHLRGRPGAHAVVVLPKGKSASLETLLDAATLTLHFSGGTQWGKTDVDYTFRKNVKRIKDSTQVSYTQNKTLVVQVDQGRLKRLLADAPVLPEN